MLRTYGHLRRAIETTTWVLTGLLVVLVVANVFARYVLEIGILWAEELSRLAFVWVVFLGSYVALCRKGHMAMEVGVQQLPVAAQRPVLIASRFLVLIFLAALVFSGAKLVLTTVGFGRLSPILGISAGWGYLSVPVSAALMFLEVLRELIAGDLPPLTEAEALKPGVTPEAEAAG
ncbi:MAG TPA: TRAP transporter small permease [Beijerinckiaceae bacterium]|nr:TRAP transporter small permease [Beijerinckiaceae bacterium]